MLILTRKEGQSIIINNNIEIIISSIDGEQVKIGINAPQDVNILRKEVYEAVKENNRAAIRSKIDLKELKKLTDPDK